MIIESIRAEYLRYKALAEGAIAQVDDAGLCLPGAGGGNSLAVICWHLSGNFRSRFTDFLTSDGEKPWRQREEEFESRTVSRAALLAKWEEGWAVVLGALADLTDDQLGGTVTIRGQALLIATYNSHHAGQVVLLRQLLGKWPPRSGGLTWEARRAAAISAQRGGSTGAALPEEGRVSGCEVPSRVNSAPRP